MNSSISILDVFNVEVLGVRTYLKQAEMYKKEKFRAIFDNRCIVSCDYQPRFTNSTSPTNVPQTIVLFLLL